MSEHTHINWNESVTTMTELTINFLQDLGKSRRWLFWPEVKTDGDRYSSGSSTVLRKEKLKYVLELKRRAVRKLMGQQVNIKGRKRSWNLGSSWNDDGVYAPCWVFEPRVMILQRTVIYTPLPIPILYTIPFHFLVSHTFSSWAPLSLFWSKPILHLGFCDSWCVCFTSVSVTQFAALRFEQPPHNLALDPSFSLLHYPRIYIYSPKTFRLHTKRLELSANLVSFIIRKMGTVLPQHQAFDVSVDVLPQSGSKCFDDDGRLKRTGKFFSSPSVSGNALALNSCEIGTDCLCCFMDQELFGQQVLTSLLLWLVLVSCPWLGPQLNLAGLLVLLSCSCFLLSLTTLQLFSLLVTVLVILSLEREITLTQMLSDPTLVNFMF